MPDQTDLLTQAVQQYPYLRDKGLMITYSPQRDDGRLLEFWNPTEQGAPGERRPTALPLGGVGLEVFDQSKTRPIDVLGDYVSHYAVENDPKLKELYKRFENAVPEKTLRERYDYHVKNHGEQRAFSQWKKSSGLPELFRGYTFNQWGDNAKDFYTPEQLRILDQARGYLGITQ